MTAARKHERQRQGQRSYKRLSFLFCVICLVVSAASADVPEIRKDILEDCGKAKEKFSALSEKEKKDLIPYIKLVLGMNPSAAAPAMQNPPAIPQQQPFLPGRVSRSLGEDLVRAVEPKRELEAKRCAVSLLEDCGVAAFELMPELIRLSFDKTQPFDFLDQLDNAVWEIALSVSRQTSCAVVESQLERLFELMSEAEGSSLPGNVLIQTGNCSAGYLVDMLRNTDGDLSRRTMDILRNIDDTGRTIGPQLLAYLEDEDSNLRRMALQMLSTLRVYFNQALLPVLRMLQTPSDELNPEILRVLGIFFAEQGLLEGHPQREEILQILFEQFEKAPDSERGTLQTGIEQFKILAPLWRERLQRLAVSPDAGLRRRAFVILGQLRESKDIGFLMRRVLAEGDADVELAAIEALGAGQAQLSKVLSTFIQVLKGSAAKEEILLNQRRICSVAKAMERLAGTPAFGSKAAAPFVRYFIDNLRYRDFSGNLSECAAVKKMLASYADISLPELLKLLQDKDKVVQQRALSVIAMMSPPPEKAIPALIDLLSSPDRQLVDAGQTLLLSYGAGIQAKLKSALKAAVAAKKVPLAEVLLMSGYRGPELRDILTKAWPAAACDAQTLIFLDLLKLDSSLIRELNEKVIICLINGHLPKELGFKVAPSLTSPEKGSKGETELRAFFDRQDADPLIKLALLKRGLELGFTDKEIAAWTIESLKRVDDPIKVALFPVLENVAGKSENVIPLLEGFILESRNMQLVSQAMTTLFTLRSPSFNYNRMLLDELGGDRLDVLQTALSHAPASFVVPLLVSMLHQDDARLRQRALSMIGAIPGQNGLAVPELLKFLLTPHDLEERYLAAVALLRVQPEGEAALMALRKEIVGRYRERLIAESFDEREKAVFKKIAQSPSSFLEQQTAKTLLLEESPSLKVQQDTSRLFSKGE